jgi:hypothetical protein
MAAASLAGLLIPAALYPTVELRQSFVSNDVVNLLIGLPILLGSLALARRGRWIGLLLWPGALFYSVYNYLAYSVALLPFWAGWIALALALLCAAGIWSLAASLDPAAIRARLEGNVPRRLAGGVLAGLGGLFFVRTLGALAAGLGGGSSPAGAELGTLIADLLTTPWWVVGGALLWRRSAWGYAAGAGLLFTASMLFIGLLVFFILQPFTAGAAFPAADFVVILAMGLVCFIPTGLFLRGAARG